MTLAEIEFELPALQHEWMGYPTLKQGEPLTLSLDTGILSPDSAVEGWYTVQLEPLPAQFVQVGRAIYAFSGQIRAADLLKAEGVETAALLVDCGAVILRVYGAPQEDGRLPYGAWETRYLAGYSRIYGVVEEDFSTPIGHPIGVTIWGFRRLTLRPGDPLFGQWHESSELLSTPYQYDRVLISARLHGTRG
jgi:hypothetical protein